MKKNILLSIIIITLIITFFSFIISCGVLLDTVRIEGEWELAGAEFYAYNSSIDTNYVYKGINKKTPSSTQPITAAFFGASELPNKGNYKFIINFSADKRIRIYDLTDDENKNTEEDIVKVTKGKWNVDNYENTINLRIYEDDVTNDNLLSKNNFWRNGGFLIKNYWPMTSYTTLEITIKSEDIGKQLYIYLDDNKRVKIHTMKGIFNRPE